MDIYLFWNTPHMHDEVINSFRLILNYYTADGIHRDNVVGGGCYLQRQRCGWWMWVVDVIHRDWVVDGYFLDTPSFFFLTTHLIYCFLVIRVCIFRTNNSSTDHSESDHSVPWQCLPGVHRTGVGLWRVHCSWRMGTGEGGGGIALLWKASDIPAIPN